MRSVFTLCFLVALTLPGVAHASVSYHYVGNNFTETLGAYTTDMRVTGTFELAEPLAPNLIGADISGDVLSYSLDDGRNTFSDLSHFIGLTNVSTDSLGNITGWNFRAAMMLFPANLGDEAGSVFTTSAQDVGQIHRCVTSSGCDVGGVGRISLERGRVIEAPGTWTFIPEPSTALLLALGLVGIAMRRRQVRYWAWFQR